MTCKLLDGRSTFRMPCSSVYVLPPGALGPLPTPHLNEPRTCTSKRKDLFFACKHGARADDFGGEALYMRRGVRQ